MLSLTQIEDEIHSQEVLMTKNQKEGRFIQADACKKKIVQLEQQYARKSSYQLSLKHQREVKEVEEVQFNQMNSFYLQAEKETQQIEVQGASQQRSMKQRHLQQIRDLSRKLEGQLSLKLKPSSELLNLKQMQQFMAKQKKYQQAHLIQTQIAELEYAQQHQWEAKRNQKINNQIHILKGKHEHQLQNLRKRIKTSLDEHDKVFKVEEARLAHKHDNIRKDLKSQQEKEKLNFKGEFRSKGGKDSPMRTRSSFISTSDIMCH